MKTEIKYLLAAFLLFLVTCSLSYAADLVEIVYPAEMAKDEIEKSIRESLIRDQGGNYGDYYYRIFKECKEDTLLKKPSGPSNPVEYFKNGERLSEPGFKEYMKSQESAGCKIVRYQKSATGELLQLGMEKGTSGFKPNIRPVENLLSQAKGGSIFSKWYFWGGIGVLGAAAGGGGGGGGGSDSGGTSPAGPTAPNPPTNVAVTATTNTSVNITWTDSSNEEGYAIRRSLTGIDGSWINIIDVSANTTNYTDNTVWEKGTFYYRVLARGGGFETYLPQNDKSVTTPGKPNNPSNATCSAPSYSQVNLSWNDSSNDETEFRIYRSINGPWSYGWYATVGAGVTSFIDLNPPRDVDPSTNYYYKIYAWNVWGESIGGSNETNATTKSAPSSPPAAPTGTTATAASYALINVTWTDASNNEAGFYINRSEVFGGPYPVQYRVDPGIQSFSDITVTPSTTYYYVVQSYNFQGTGNSAEVSAATPAIPLNPPITPSNLTVIAVSSSAIDVYWDDNSSDEEGFKLYRNTTGTDPFTQIATIDPNTEVYSDTGLASSTTFYYKIEAYNSQGGSMFAGVASATTPAQPTNPPSPPNTLNAVAVSDSQVNITWNDTSGDEEGFYIYRQKDGTGTWNYIKTVGIGVESYSDTGLDHSTKYWYYATAYNSAGESGQSNQDDALTNPPPATKPLTPTNVSAVAISAKRINLSWQDNSWNETEFRVYRWTLSGGPYTLVISGTLNANVTSFSDTVGLLANTPYYYVIRAYNLQGETGNSTEVSATTYPAPATTPTPPSGLSGYAPSSSQIKLTWVDNSDNEDGFKIERADNIAGPYTAVGYISTGTNKYLDSGLTFNATYHYRVRAYNSAGDSDYNYNSAQTQNLPGSAPSQPGGISFDMVNSSQFILSWWDSSSDEEGFRLERAYHPEQAYTVIATIDPSDGGTIKYTDTGLEPSTRYYYKLYAFNSQGDSTPSETNQQTLDTFGAVPVTPTGLSVTAQSGKVQVRWTDASIEELCFKILRQKTGDLDFTHIMTVSANQGSGTQLTYYDIGISPSTTYTYKIKATNYAGESTSGTASDITYPSAPSLMVATSISPTRIDLNWQDNSIDETGFRIERKVGQFGSFSNLPPGAGSNVISATDDTVSASTEYWYRIQAYRGGDYSSYSNESYQKTPPPAPTNLSKAVYTSPDKVSLSWSYSNGDHNGFKIERKFEGETTFTQIGTSGQWNTWYDDSTVTPSNIYTYRVRAYRNSPAADSPYSDEIIAQTYPAAPSSFNAIALSSYQAVISWTDNSDDELDFYIERSPAFGSTITVSAVAGTGSVITYTDNTITTTSGTNNFWYYIKARNAVGYSGTLNSDQVVGLGYPLDLLAMVTDTANAISISWTNNSAPWAGFKLERKNGGGYAEIGTATGSPTVWYGDLGLSNSVTYTYRARSYYTAGSYPSYSSYSNEASDSTWPSAPSGLTGIVLATNEIAISWTDTSSDETGFIIARKKEGEGFFSFLDAVISPASAYTDTDITDVVTYYYKVRAYRLDPGPDYSTFSNTVEFMPNNATLADTAWPKAHCDLANTSRAEYAGPTTGGLKWAALGMGGMTSAAVLDSKGNVYIGTTSRLESYDSTGAKRWVYDIPQYIGSNDRYIYASPALGSDGTIYICVNTMDGLMKSKLYAVRSSDGAYKWDYPSGAGVIFSSIYSAPTIGSDGTVYFGAGDGKLYAVNPDGSPKWDYFPAMGSIEASPAIDSQGFIYCGTTNGYMFAHNPDNSGNKWSRNFGAFQIKYAPAIDEANSVVYVAVSSQIYALNLSDGLNKYNPYNVGFTITTAPAIGSGEVTYFAVNNGSLYSVTPTAGSLAMRWSYDPPPAAGVINYGVTIGKNLPNPIIYFYDDMGDYVCALKDTGVAPVSPEWTYSVGVGSGYNIPVIGSDGTLYIGSNGSLYAINNGGSTSPDAVYSQIMFRSNVSRTGQSTFAGPTSTTEAHTYPAGGSIQSSAAVDKDGNIYFGCNSAAGSSFYCINKDAGNQWSTLVGMVKSSPAISAVKQAVYFGDDSGVMHSYPLVGGAPRWSYGTAMGAILSSPAITGDASNTRVYFAAGSTLYALYDDMTAGRLLWQVNPSGSPFESSPALDKNGKIYIGCNDNKVYCYQDTTPYAMWPGTYNTLWNTGVQITAQVKATPLVAGDGYIYVGDLSGRFHQINANTGAVGWSVNLGAGNSIWSSAALSLDGTTLYVGCNNGNLYARNKSDGSEKWTFNAGIGIQSSPTVDSKGRIYFGTLNDGFVSRIYALTDTGTAGTALSGWPKEYAGGGANGFISSVSIMNTGQLVVGNMNNTLYIIGTDPADIQITKKANKQKVSVGDVVTYKITLTNNGVDPTDINNPTQLIDRIPPGFKYVKGSSILIDGAGNITRTDPAGVDTNTLTYDAGWFGTTATATTKVVSYQLVVGSGVAFGKYENRAYARFWYNKPPVTEGTSNIAREEVLVVPDPIFDLGTIIGKVFEDTNGNGIQDEGEVGVGQAKIIMEDGTVITTDKDGKYHVPGVVPGTHALKLQVTGDKLQVKESPKIVRVTEGLLCKVNFPIDSKNSINSTNSSDSGAAATSPKQSVEGLHLLVLGEGIAGYNTTSGNTDIVNTNKVNEGFDDGFTARGRLAYYMSGTFKKDYTITSSFDSKRDRYRAMSRYIDPDKYYPLYGDDSTVAWDATNTQGLFYLSAGHTPSASQVLVGNYQTDLASNELFAYNRTLYGAKVALNTNNNRADYLFIPNTEVKLFGARAYQVAAHNEFRATGGSFYYLKHKNVIEGSEEVKLVSRDQLTNLPVETIIKTRGVDYEIDYDMGRIIFKQVVNSVDPTSSIISTNILNGNGMYIVVDYEYEPDRTHLNEGVYGGRVAYSPIDEVTIGTGYVSEEELDKDYTLGGADLTVKLPLETKVKVEYAQSESRGIPNYVSLNGGLTFNEVTNLSSSEGSAYYIKADSKPIENITTDVYYQHLRPGFMSSNAVIQQGTAKYGTSISDKLTDKLNLSVRYDVQELLKNYNLVSGALVGGEKTEVTSLQGNYNMTEKLTLSGEYRYQSVENKLAKITSETNSDTSVGAVRANYALSQRVNMYMSQQTTFKGPANHQTSLGSTIQIMDNLSGNIQGTSGTNGNSALLGLSSVNKIGEKTELTNSFNYGLTESTTNERTRSATTTAGVSSQVTDSTRLYASKQYQVSSGGAVSTADTIGQDTNFTKNWIVGCTFERGLLNNFDGTET
ncbi:MAG: PQQ-binding-like beta-propeller repeat protein, partial [Planctomycetes bacterium]|nr:PQQ-binding-like beta-propeller repeat protein [Planctomycetota bacterium]